MRASRPLAHHSPRKQAPSGPAILAAEPREGRGRGEPLARLRGSEEAAPPVGGITDRPSFFTTLEKASTSGGSGLRLDHAPS
jgi:hypothetical protein